jgi:phytanoyl-CoA hydroxylase
MSDKFDQDWYLATYPLVIEEIANGLSSSPQEHFATRGRARGYLSNPSAERPRDAAAMTSAFGGLWVDQANALDVLEGRLDLGMINESDAAALRTFIRDGYAIFEQAIPVGIVDAAREALEFAYDGKDSQQRFECLALGHQFTTWIPELKEHSAKAVEIHTRSEAIRDCMFAPVIGRFLNLIFERRAMASQTLGFYRGSGQGPHQDSAYVSYSLNKQFAASWVALEDAHAGAGELFYYPGSQNAPDFLYGGRYKNISDAKRSAHDWSGAEIQHHVNSLPNTVAKLGCLEKTFIPKKGDALIWAADLVHGGKPISTSQTRKSLVTHYCPVDVAPLYFEDAHRKHRIHRHSSGNFWTTFLS